MRRGGKGSITEVERSRRKGIPDPGSSTGRWQQWCVPRMVPGVIGFGCAEWGGWWGNWKPQSAQIVKGFNTRPRSSNVLLRAVKSQQRGTICSVFKRPVVAMRQQPGGGGV